MRARTFIYYVIGLGLMPLLASCADTEQYIADVEHDPVFPSFQEVLQMWEDLLNSYDYVEPDETIPTDETDPEYDDFIENQDFKASRVITITWSENSVTVDNPQAEKGVEITVNGTRVIVRNLESEVGADDARGKVSYLLQGRCEDGQFKVYSNKKFQLILNELHLTCSDGPAISIQEKKRCFVTLSGQNSSRLCDGEVYASDAVPTGEDEKGCLFSEGQLIFTGKGTLTVRGLHQHGIASDEYVRVHPGCEIWVNAVKDGIHTKERYQQSGGLVRSYAQKDALQSDSLGIWLTGGYLYLFGERAMTANGGGQISVTAPGKVCPIDWTGIQHP